MLGHPNTVRVYDFGQTPQGAPFLVLEYLDGRPRAEVIAGEAPLDPARVAWVSLQEAHSEQIVHRDLKPDNVFLCHFEDQEDVVRVCDFDIARVLEEDESGSVLTKTGAVVGTPRYMSPSKRWPSPPRAPPTSTRSA